MSMFYICNRCGEMMDNVYTRFTVDCLRGHLERGGYVLDLCEECNEEFEKFMNPAKDELSTDKLRTWSEVGPPPKINGYPLSTNDESDSDVAENHPMIYGCKQCEFEYTSINDEPCFSCGYGKSNFKPKGYYDACEQCKFKDFSWDEEPCSTCKYSVMNDSDDPSDNFESKEEEGTSNLSKAKYKISSYIQSDNGKGDIYKIVDVSLRDDGVFMYKVKNLSISLYSAFSTISEMTIDNWYTVIVKYSCEGCKLEGTSDVTCDTCIVGDPKGPRRQWWKPKEEEE